MKNLYMLKNIRTGVIEYDNLYAQDVHDLIRHGAIQTQEVEDNGKEHHTGADRTG